MAAPHEPAQRAVPGPGGSTAPPPTGDDERSLADLLSTLTSQLSTLFRKEVELARTEIKQEVRLAGKAAGTLGGAGGAAFMAVLLLSFALAWGLGELVPVWAGFLIVGALYAVVAGALFVNGKKKLDRINPKPEQTIETLKEDAEWARTRKS
jgi:hypothetical protein